MKMYDYLNRSTKIVSAIVLLFLVSLVLTPFLALQPRPAEDAPFSSFRVGDLTAAPQTVPGSGTAFSLFQLPTTTGLLGGTAVRLNQQGGDTATSTTPLTGPTSIYGIRVDGATPCYLNIYDYSTAAQVTPGTTTPLTSVFVSGSSGGIFQPTNFPTFTVQQGLVVTASTSPGGSTNCSTSPVIQGWYKR